MRLLFLFLLDELHAGSTSFPCEFKEPSEHIKPIWTGRLFFSLNGGAQPIRGTTLIHFVIPWRDDYLYTMKFTLNLACGVGGRLLILSFAPDL